MCRSTSNGGRRCPSHSDPVAIANRNARRRALYRKSKKSGGAKPETTHTGALTTPSVDPTHPLFTRDFYHVEAKERYLPNKDSAFNEKLNVTVTEHDGRFVNMGYFAGKEVNGVINYTNLDENSYLEFGFKPAEEDRGSYKTFEGNKQFSQAELQDLTQDQKDALSYYTGDSYLWLNSALYGNGNLFPDQKGYESATFDGLHPDTGSWQENMMLEQNTAHLKKVTTLLDSALTEGPGKPRILYRGMSSHNPVFGQETVDTEISPAHEWVKKNITLGQELIFDGYQSASISEKVATDYASFGQGLVYEILTPEGVNVTSVSQYGEEQEVLLPRGCRYMVVGVHQNVQYGSGEEMSVVQLVAIDNTGAALSSTNRHAAEPLKDSQMKVDIHRTLD